MTTKVRIEIVQQHMPVEIFIVDADGKERRAYHLDEAGKAIEEYVHSGQSLKVVEAKAILDDPVGCKFCGAMAGACAEYPNCPNGPNASTEAS